MIEFLDYTFKKEEKLCSRKAIEELVKGGYSEFCYPFKVQWKQTSIEQKSPVQIAFSVPKRIHKRANKRNTIKRRLREAYRINKFTLYDVLFAKELKIQILMVYISNEILTYQEIEVKLKKLLFQIEQHVQKVTK